MNKHTLSQIRHIYGSVADYLPPEDIVCECDLSEPVTAPEDAHGYYDVGRFFVKYLEDRDYHAAMTFLVPEDCPPQLIILTPPGSGGYVLHALESSGAKFPPSYGSSTGPYPVIPSVSLHLLRDKELGVEGILFRGCFSNIAAFAKDLGFGKERAMLEDAAAPSP